jgi:hypothetical protein
MKKGHNVEYTGKETVDGIEVFVLKLTRTNGHVETWYLNAETYLEYLCRSDWVDFAYPAPAETFFDDFRNIDGLILPFFIDRTFWQRSRILQIEEVEVNPEIDKEMFIMPRREEMTKFEFLAGDWDVNVKAWTPRGTWYDLGNTTSSFNFVSTNMLQEEISYNRIYLINKLSSFTYYEPDDNYRVSIYNDLSNALTMFVGTFNDTAFIFDNAQITYGNDSLNTQPANQYIIYNIEDNGFILERNVSRDQGKSWRPADLFTYTRKEEQ